LFDLDKQIFGEQSAQVIASQAATQSLEQRQRDIYDSHRHRTYALAYYMTGNEVEAEQILVQAFTRAFSANTDPDANGIDQALLQELRAAGAMPESEAPPPPVATESASCGNIRRTELEEALRTLPASERLVFLLHDVERYSPAAIAQLVGLPAAQVNRTLVHARIRLRQALSGGQLSRREAA
jgi:RNA polymerase sigma factor (sigma-70 family)